MPTILGIEVPVSRLRQWTRWLAPDPQPFFVASANDWPGTKGQREDLSEEVAATYQVWRVPRSLDLVWMSEVEFFSLPRHRRAALVRAQVSNGREVPTVKAWSDLVDATLLRAQADGHRFVWWSALVETAPEAILARVMSKDRLPSRHTEVDPSTWRNCATVLPGAKELAGTFPPAGGPHCFSTVMAAAGLPDTTPWETTEPFDEWLERSTVRGGSDADLGTVYVWRTHDGRAFHAAVGIGDGWALEKPSVDWHSPRAVVSVADLVRSNTYKGQRLSRYRLVR